MNIYIYIIILIITNIYIKICFNVQRGSMPVPIKRRMSRHFRQFSK